MREQNQNPTMQLWNDSLLKKSHFININLMLIAAVRFGRVPKREKAKMLAAMEKSHLKTQESKVMTEMADPSQVIEVVVNAHFNTCDYTKRKLEYFVSTAKAKPSYTFFTGSVYVHVETRILRFN